MPQSPPAGATTTGSLRGQVVDPSGAAIAGATVLVLPLEGPSITTNTNRDGFYEAKAVADTRYTVQVVAAGFARSRLEEQGWKFLTEAFEELPIAT